MADQRSPSATFTAAASAPTPPPLNPPPSQPAPSPTRLICGNPFTDDATDDAARQGILQRMTENSPLYQATMRQACFEATVH